ncbi:DUF397 domain-containing protein [Streptomyces triculaminicus]|uniref:DUF397 domain-containing protein n=1 Tax=Streptomyces triculaminicus TaxID=2816232 RepID=UPI0033C78151
MKSAIHHALLEFRASSYSSGGQNCVEVADPAASPSIAIRDSKYPHGPIILIGRVEYSAFTRAVKAGGL